MRRYQYNRRGGFTLIEMSIVLVIIGLIVGGILTGQQLIRSAELKSIITDEQKYVTAVNTFRGKYNELPGDMVDATNYWGADAYCPSGGNLTTDTCNGNGNGLIEDIESAAGGTLATYEGFHAWWQLAQVGLIQGSYTGSPSSISWGSSVPGLNVPQTRIPSGGFDWVVFENGGRGNGGTWGANVQFNTQYLLVGTNTGSAQGPNDGGAWDLSHALFNAADAMAIDQKMDDGFPATGSVLGSQFYSYSGYPWCVTTSGSTPIYDLTVKSPGCTLLFQVKSW